MPLARVNGTLLHFVHIPKTGGSSVKEYLKAKGQLAMFNRTRLKWGRTCPQHITSNVHNILIPPGFADHEFIVFRDPMARLISEFRYRSQPADDNGVAWVDLDEGGRFEGSFDQWVARVFAMHRKDAHACDNHIRPQSDFWSENLQAFFFEDGIDQIFQWIDLVTDTPPLDRDLHENRGRWVEIQISDATREMVDDFYAADHALMGRLRKEKAAQDGPPDASDFRGDHASDGSIPLQAATRP